MRFRVFGTLAVLVAAIGLLAVGVGSAAAKGTGVQEGYNYAADPQTTNIPWVAWAGETVKVTRCFGLGDSQVGQDEFTASSFNRGGSPFIGEFDKSDWSGATDQPPFFQIGTGDQTSRQVTATWNANGGVCFSTDVTSEKAGLERIKFSISTDLGKWLNFVLGQDVIFQQDLYVIWMWDSNPVLTEADTTGAYAVGDPGASNSFSPIADPVSGWKTLQPGLLKVQVTGTFPMGNDFAGYDFTGTALDNGTITLPTDWPWLANHFAEDYTLGSTYPGATPMRWDIHDGQDNSEGHVLASNCNDKIGPTESVDNCIGSSPDPDLGPFSSIFGLVGTQNDAYGPFDPIRSFETLLSDGNLNADDTPMPALRVDVGLTNVGADHSVGTLSKADKSAIFNRNDPAYGGNTTDLGAPHQLYAPFYKAYLPAVVPIIDENTTSGVEGSIGGNYGNWLTSGAYNVDTTEQAQFIYDYWDTFTLDSHWGNNSCYGADGSAISQPNGNTQVAVYTDEHGQAYVQFNPANQDGEGIYLTPDSNGRCDVYSGSLVGTATIQAESVYPAQQPADPGNSGKPKLSGIITKTVNFTPSKVLNCIPKSTNEAYCVETVTDFEGNPIKADVEFTLQSAQGGNPNSWGADFNKVGGYDPSGQKLNAYNTDYVDLTTDPNTGQAAIYVHSSTNACIDVTVENLGTRNGGAGITRDFDFNPTSGAKCGTNSGTGPITPPAGGGTPPAASTGGASGGSTAAPVSVTAAAPTIQTTAKVPAVAKKVTMTLVSARVVSTRSGRFLNARVNSSAKFATLRITLVSKNGTSHIVLRKVATNHVVRVANLKLAPSVKTVRVAIA